MIMVRHDVQLQTTAIDWRQSFAFPHPSGATLFASDVISQRLFNKRAQCAGKEWRHLCHAML